MAVSPAAQARYRGALTAVHDATPLRQRVEPWCRPAAEPARRPRAPWAGAAAPNAAPRPAPSEPGAAEGSAHARAARPRRVRALHPLAAPNRALWTAVSQQEFLRHGRRNRDLRRLRDGDQAAAAREPRRPSAAGTRPWRRLRGQGLIHQVPKTHRDVVSEAGRPALTALLAACNARAEHWTRCAG